MKKNQIILIIIGVFILIGLVLGFIYWLKYIKPGTEISGPTGEDLCAEFSKIEGEVTCQEAINSVLEKYPGEVKYVKKTKDFLPIGIFPEGEMVEKEVWLIGINLEEPMGLDETELKSMEIFVTRDRGELEINRVMSGEI